MSRAAYMRTWRKRHPKKTQEQSRRRKADPVQHEKQLTRAREWQRVWRSKPENMQKQYDTRILRLYGVTPAQVEQVLVAQGNCCAICGAKDPGTHRGKPTRWHIDHHHATNEFRGLLCNNCNNGVGRFKDDPELLARAYNYVTDPPAKHVLA